MPRQSWLRMACGLALAAGLLAACNAPAGSGSSVAAIATQPAPTGVPTLAPIQGVDCDNALFPVAEGAAWMYNTSGTAGNSTRIDTITDVGNDGFLVETKLTDITYVEAWDCTDKGLVNLQPDAGTFSALFQGPQGMVTFQPGEVTGVTIPQTVKAGDTWTQVVPFAFTSNSISGSGTLTYDFTAVGPEEVTVPEGTFSSLRIDVQATMEVTASGGSNKVTYTSSDWFAPGTGLVKMAGSGSTSGTKFETNIELAQHSIP